MLNYMFTVRHLLASKQWALQNALAFLAARAGVLDGLHPFGAALFVALFAAGDRLGAMAVGVSIVVGSLTSLSISRTLAVALGAFACVAFIPVRMNDVPPHREGGTSAAVYAENRLLKTIVLASLAMGASRVLVALPSRPANYDIISMVAEALMIGIFARLLVPLAHFQWSRPMASGDRQQWIALSFLVGVAGLGLASFQIGHIRPLEVWIRWVTMVAALVGHSGAGASVGTLFGVLVSLAGVVPLGGRGLYGIGGLFGGLAGKKGKVGVALGFVLGQLLVSLFASDADDISLGLTHTGIAVVLMALTSDWRIARLSKWLPGTDAQVALARAKEERVLRVVGDKMGRLSDLFLELASVFSFQDQADSGDKSDKNIAPRQHAVSTIPSRSPSVNTEASTYSSTGDVSSAQHLSAASSNGAAPGRQTSDFQPFVEDIWRTLCQGCAGFDTCWQRHGYRSYWDLVLLVSAADSGSDMTVVDMPEGIASRCFRQEELLKAVTEAARVRPTPVEPDPPAVVENTDKEAATSIGRVVPMQLLEVAELLRYSVDSVRRHAENAEKVEIFLKDQPGLRPVDYADVKVVRAGDFPEVDVVYEGECDGLGQCGRQTAKAMERATGKAYRAVTTCRTTEKPMCTLQLKPVPAFTVEYEVCHAVKDGHTVSGDTFARFDLEAGQTALLISDGMGAGKLASLQSKSAVGLLEKMMVAGFDRSFAVKTVNHALLMRSEKESFATVDLALIDTFTGETQFLKSGSSPTFIFRRGNVHIVRSRSLPVGILRGIDVTTEKMMLSPDDVFIMATDGLLDILPNHVDKEEWMTRLLKGESARAPHRLAPMIVDRARRLADGRMHDDVTVVVARIVRRRVQEEGIPEYVRTAF